MSKNITIEEGSQGRNFTARKLQTQTTSGGMATWIPEDEAADYISTASKTVNENGEFSAEDDGVDAYSDVDVEVLPNLQAKKVIRANGEYNAEDEGVDGYASVKVKVSGGKAKLKTKTVTQNGTYNPSSDGADGYSSVTVNVSSEDDYYYAWESDSDTAPISGNGAAVAVHEDRVHVIHNYNHYAWDGKDWEKISNAPYDSWCAPAISYNGGLHLMGSGGGYPWHAVWNGSKWEKVSDIPTSSFNSSVAVYEDRLHFFDASMSQGGDHYAWDGEKWEKMSTLPIATWTGKVVLYKNKFHCFAGTAHYVFNGSEWEEAADLPVNFNYHAAGVYDGKMHILIGNNHRRWNDEWWRTENNCPLVEGAQYGMKTAVLYKKKLRILLDTKMYSMEKKTSAEKKS